MKARLAKYGRSEDSLKIMPAVTVVVGDTDADAVEKAAYIREQQVSGPTALVLAELLWGATSPRTTRMARSLSWSRWSDHR